MQVGSSADAEGPGLQCFQESTELASLSHMVPWAQSNWAAGRGRREPSGGGGKQGPQWGQGLRARGA